MKLKTDRKKEMIIDFAKSDFYQLLAQSIQFPTIQLIEAMIDGRYAEDGISILKDLTNGEIDDTSTFDFLTNIVEAIQNPTTLLKEMRREYSRLFTNPSTNLLPIYETTFLSADAKSEKTLFVSPMALAAERAYKEAGVTLVNQSTEPADYLVTELEFMMYLYSKKGQAIHEQDEEALSVVKKQIHSFEKNHMEKWVYDFFDKLEKLSPNTPYFTIATFAKSGLKHSLSK